MDKMTIRNTHPDRLISANGDYSSLRVKSEACLKEAKEKGYTIIPCHDPNKKMYGYVMRKMIDGEEIAYNPMWYELEGKIDGF